MATQSVNIPASIPGFKGLTPIHVGKRTLLYAAQRESDSVPVVLKTTRNAYPALNEISLLRHEFETLNGIEISGISKVQEMIHVGNRPVLSLDNFGGVPLSEYFGSQPADLEEFLDVAIKITDILGSIHAANIIHKDINTENILINRDTKALQIIDFGICAQLSQERTAARNPNVLEGTLAFMSPEQTGRMNRNLDYRTDLYSLGVTFYRILSGELPFSATEPLELVHCHIAKAMVPLSSRLNRFPVVLSNIVEKLTEKIAENRYQSASGLKYDLEECKRRLREDQTIEEFPLATRDVFSKFRIPGNLYGREYELELLMQTYDNAAKGNCEFSTISGFSGIGKSSLINEIHKPTVKLHGHFISGKCDQFRSNLPFNVFSQAFTELLRYIACEPDESVAQIKDQLMDALGLNASVLVELIPEFDVILGKQVKSPDLNPLESKNRFFFTIVEFLKVLATKEHPLVIFLDDLQWADDASLALIKEIINKEIPYLFIIGAYRNNEVQQGHPLVLALEEIAKFHKIHEINLGPISEKHVNQLVSDTLQQNLENTAELAALLFKRTAGNPFYINELLKSMYAEKYLQFSHESGLWVWDMEKLQGINISGNVIEILDNRLKELPELCVTVLQYASGIGNTFDLKTLSLVCQKSASEVARILLPAIEAEIILPLGEDYRLILDNEDFGISYKFHHDKIQQSAYQQIKEETRKELHLWIGRVILENSSEEELTENAISTVRHFNEGLELITDANEKVRIASLNLLAGDKAQSAISYLAAVQYYKAGISLLSRDPWNTNYQLTFNLHKGFAQNSYQIGDNDTAEAAIDLLISKAQTKLEKVDVLAVRLRQYRIIGKASEAIDAGIQGLKLLGYNLSPKPSPIAVLKELLTVKWRFGKRKPEDLLDLKLMTDPEKKAAARLLIEIGPSAYVLGNDNLYGLSLLKIVNISLQHGHCPESPFAYVAFGMVLGDVFGDYAASYGFGKLALEINERFGDIEYRCRTIAAYAVFTHHYNHHWKTCPDIYKKGIESGYLSGDLFFLGFCASNRIYWDPTIDLASALEEQRKNLKIVLNTGYVGAISQAIMYLQMTKSLLGLLPNPSQMDDGEYTEKEVLDMMAKNDFTSGLAFYHANKTYLYLMYEEYENALQSALEAKKYSKAMVNLTSSTVYFKHTFFICTALLKYGKNPNKNLLYKLMKTAEKNYKKWTKYNPQNFEHVLLLMQAEKANVEHRYADAIGLYDKAIKTANTNNWQGDEAYANELAAKFYLSNGSNKAAAGYFQEAWYLYDKWGANGKLEFLEKKYASFFTDTKELTVDGTIHHQTTNIKPFHVTENMQTLDLATIVKSSQAISGEIELKSLLDKMMQIIVQNAGAENGVLLLDQGDGLAVQATFKNNKTSTLQNEPIAESKIIPKTVVNYVSNLLEPLVLAQASVAGKFVNDEYIAKNNIKSVLCSPIVLLNKLYGIIYLENNVSDGAFTEDRLKVVQLLSSQMAISIQNAMLYANLEKRVEERTSELREEKQKSDDLLNNILPEKVADELKQYGKTTAQSFDSVTVMFTDFKNFTQATEALSAEDLVHDINNFYSTFDRIITKYKIEKIKTIGDSYMCAGGLPVPGDTHPQDVVNAAIEIRDYMLAYEAEKKASEQMHLEIRIGIHTGPVIAGVVGMKKFAYDIWGDTVNLASRMESSGEPGKINISGSTYELIKDHFDCDYRGKVNAKNKGEVDMYFVNNPK